MADRSFRRHPEQSGRGSGGAVFGLKKGTKFPRAKVRLT